MDYCSIEDAWGVKSFSSGDVSLTQPPCPDPIRKGPWSVSGPFGYRAPDSDGRGSRLHPVAACYMENGVDGILHVLPTHAIDELRHRLATSSLNVVAGGLLLGFVLLILWDVLIKRR